LLWGERPQGHRIKPLVDEHDWMIRGELEEFVHIGWATK